MSMNEFVIGDYSI